MGGNIQGKAPRKSQDCCLGLREEAEAPEIWVSLLVQKCEAEVMGVGDVPREEGKKGERSRIQP